ARAAPPPGPRPAVLERVVQQEPRAPRSAGGTAGELEPARREGGGADLRRSLRGLRTAAPGSRAGRRAPLPRRDLVADRQLPLRRPGPRGALRPESRGQRL